ncbi:MAG TPA: hypothetical protein VKB95_02265 [Chitinophagaceae bacterium]|nr:hypothetical protein [Chitinophagaceae bacterium]
MAKNKAQTINKDHAGGSAVKKSPIFRIDERNFGLVVDGVPYTVKSIPFSFNDELRFRIILNGASEHVFTWDSEIGMLRAIDDDSSVLPAGLEEALSEKLQSQLK